MGWYWWRRGSGLKKEGEKGRVGEGEKGRVGEMEKKELNVTRVNFRTGMILAIVFVGLYLLMFFGLSRLTDSPVPEWDSFITSLSIVATWMLARKIYEHWFLWIVVNIVSAVLFIWRGLYPTVILYLVYCIMSFVGLVEWKKTI
jgi:nicotinamide mononucleotide transporter